MFLKYRCYFLLFFPLAILARENETIKSSSLNTINDASTQQKKIDYPYVKLSDQWGIFPGFGIGYRSHDIHGFDLDFTAYTYWGRGCYSLYGKGHYLFFPGQGNFYLGIGAGCIRGKFEKLLSSRYHRFIKPTLESVIGYEWESKERTRLFLQLEIGGTTYGNIPVYPVVSFGIGF